MRHRSTGIAGGRRQNRYRFVAADVRQHLRHKAPAKVFKCQCRTVEQLQTANVRCNLSNRRRECKRRAYALFQDLLRDLVANKCGKDLSAAANEVLVQHLIHFCQIEFRQIVRKKQPLILAKPLRDGLRKADLFVMIFQIIEFH